VPAIIFDFKEYTCECTINIQKIRSVSIDEWIADAEDTIVLYPNMQVRDYIISIMTHGFSVA
jgi:hypothetical protein